MALKIWSKELLMLKPDPTPYLLAARVPQQVRMLSEAGVPFLYTVTTQVLEDTLSGEEG